MFISFCLVIAQTNVLTIQNRMKPVYITDIITNRKIGIARRRNPGNIYLEDNMRNDNLGQDSSTACLLAFALLLYKRMY